MPTYDYVCDACTHEFELFQPITAESEKKCPACKKKKLRRLIGAGAAIMFKGSGFYQTDYRSEAYHKSAAADKSASESKSSETKSDGGKPDAPKADASPAKASDGGKSNSSGKKSPKKSGN